jgi:AcrR family transcriptional regulator
MATGTSLSTDERRRSIIEAARPLFAERGFHAVTVREIAKAAGISEALIYKHFPSKEELYNELLDYTREMLTLGFSRVEGLEYDTQTLVTLMYATVEVIMLDVPGRIPEQKTHERLLFHSLLGDTGFAQSHFKMLQEQWSELLQKFHEAAVQAGDVVKSTIPPENLMWFVHHLAMALNLTHLWGKPTFDYEGTREELAEQAVLFCLKGIGMTDEAIRKYYRPQKVREFLDRFYKLNESENAKD